MCTAGNLLAVAAIGNVYCRKYVSSWYCVLQGICKQSQQLLMCTAGNMLAVAAVGNVYCRNMLAVAAVGNVY